MASPIIEYAPGDVAPHSGGYMVFHLRHRVAHEVILFEGEMFPACKTCRDAVRFQPVFTTSPAALERPLLNDSDFADKAA
jgi:hypothetical protein